MSVSTTDLEQLAVTLAEAGAPTLGSIIGGPVGALVGLILPKVAALFKLPASAPPAAITAAVKADPQASEKLMLIEETNRSALEFAKLQADVNVEEAKSPSLFVSGWRPFLGWSLSIMVTTQWLATSLHLPAIEISIYNNSLGLLGILLGARTIEKWKGVAAVNLK